MAFGGKLASLEFFPYHGTIMMARFSFVLLFAFLAERPSISP